MDLADSIYEANQEPERNPLDLGYDDELGLRVWDKIDYVVARAIAIGIRDRDDRYSIHQPHIRGSKVYIGNEEIEETLQNVYRLSEYGKTIRPGQLVIFWKKLKKCLPRLDPSVIQISNNLFWDKDGGEVKNEKEICEKYISPEIIAQKSVEDIGDVGNN